MSGGRRPPRIAGRCGEGGAALVPKGTGVCHVQWRAKLFSNSLLVGAAAYVNEEDGVININVMRIGSLSGRCSIDYYTVDGSAEAGIKYIAQACAGRSGEPAMKP